MQLQRAVHCGCGAQRVVHKKHTHCHLLEQEMTDKTLIHINAYKHTHLDARTSERVVHKKHAHCHLVIYTVLAKGRDESGEI
jgi:hypothetical protein